MVQRKRRVKKAPRKARFHLPSGVKLVTSFEHKGKHYNDLDAVHRAIASEEIAAVLVDFFIHHVDSKDPSEITKQSNLTDFHDVTFQQLADKIVDAEVSGSDGALLSPFVGIKTKLLKDADDIAAFRQQQRAKKFKGKSTVRVRSSSRTEEDNGDGS